MALTLVVALTGAGPVHACLGGSGDSIDAEAARLKAQTNARQFADYTIRKLSAEGLTVREYLDADGKVFALVWSAVAPPDLATLLGNYFPRYAAAVAGLEHPGLQRSLRVADADLVVETSGHLRAYVGRAWLAGRLPASVGPGDIR
jgi:hypothetical protein